MVLELMEAQNEEPASMVQGEVG